MGCSDDELEIITLQDLFPGGIIPDGISVEAFGSGGMVIDFSGSPGKDAALLSGIFEGTLQSLVQSSAIDIARAHYNYDIKNDIPAGELDDLRQIIDRNDAALCRAHAYPATREVIADMLLRETGIKASPDRIIPHAGGTRQTINELLNVIAYRKEVALGLPNWHFWNIGEDQAYNFRFFEAAEPQQLVDNFRKVAKKRKVNALILVDPANPLMYRITPEVAAEIDKIALRYGVQVVVDDVLRGVQPIGDRASIASHFTRPFIVEGFSKRFGDEPLGRYAYILTPEDFGPNPDPSEEMHEAADRTIGRLVELALKYSSTAAIEELQARNEAFDRAFYEDPVPGTSIVRPSPTHLVTLIALPQGLNAEFFRKAALHNGVATAAVCGFYPDEVDPPKHCLNAIRICVGQYESDIIERAARHIAAGIKYECNRI